MADTVTLVSTQSEGDVTMQARSITSEEFRGEVSEIDEESPLSGRSDGTESSSHVDTYSVASVNKEYEQSPVLLPTGVVMDQPGYIIVPVGNIQSKGLPSNGVLGNDGVSPSPMQGDELKSTLMHQVEYYFSSTNLATDKYLLSQMDGDNFVPVSIVANFNQVKRLTTDLDLILEVVKESPLLQLDELEEKIRAIPEKRCILILREIPQNTPQKDIMDLFSGGKCPDFISCEFAENSCWYVTFASEDDARKAFTFLREEVRTFLGQPIRARMKGTAVQRSSGLPKKPRVNFPAQSMARLQTYYPQNSGVVPWTSPPSASTSPNGVHVPYFERGSYYVPATGGNGFVPPPYGPPNRFHSYPQQSNGRNHSDILERGRIHSGGRGSRGDRSFSPSSVNGGDAYSDRERGLERSRGRGDHSRDYYRNTGGSERSRYSRDDNIQKIPRLSKKNPPRPSPTAGPLKEATEKGSADQQLPTPQQSLDLAPGNFPPLPTSEAGGTSPPSTTPTQTLDSSEAKNTSNLADIVKGRKQKESALPITITNHPPLPSASNGNIPIQSPGIPLPTDQPPQIVVQPTTNILSTVSCSATLTTAQSIMTSSSPVLTQSPSIAAVVASNIPPPTRTVTAANGAVSTGLSSASPSMTTAATVVAGSAQATTVTTSTVNPISGHSNGRPYSYKGGRGESKGAYRDRGDKGYYGNSARYTPGRHMDNNNRPNGPRNTQVLKDGNKPFFSNNRRNRDRDREKKTGPYRNSNSRPSPKPPKKHQPPPQAPPPPPTHSNEPNTLVCTKCIVDKDDESKSKSEKVSYAQMAQRKKALPSPVPLPSTQQDNQSADNKPKSLSAPSSPKGERKNNKGHAGQSNMTLKPNKSTSKIGTAHSETSLSTPSKPAFSMSAPSSPSKETANTGGTSVSSKLKDD